MPIFRFIILYWVTKPALQIPSLLLIGQITHVWPSTINSNIAVMLNLFVGAKLATRHQSKIKICNHPINTYAHFIRKNSISILWFWLFLLNPFTKQHISPLSFVWPKCGQLSIYTRCEGKHQHRVDAAYQRNCDTLGCWAVMNTWMWRMIENRKKAHKWDCWKVYFIHASYSLSCSLPTCCCWQLYLSACCCWLWVQVSGWLASLHESGDFFHCNVLIEITQVSPPNTLTQCTHTHSVPAGRP